MAGYKWKSLRRATVGAAPSPAMTELVARTLGCSLEQARERMAEVAAAAEVWINDLYQVTMLREPAGAGVYLGICRRDGYPGRDWRHFQQIKNELIGPECEAIELFPAESRLIDVSNKYHLFGVADPSFRFPIGEHGARNVDYDPARARPDTTADLRQRIEMQFARR